MTCSLTLSEGNIVLHSAMNTKMQKARPHLTVCVVGMLLGLPLPKITIHIYCQIAVFFLAALAGQLYQMDFH